MHEAGHRAFTGNPKIDKIWHWFFFTFWQGGSAGFWNNQHNKHHAATQEFVWNWIFFSFSEFCRLMMLIWTRFQSSPLTFLLQRTETLKCFDFSGSHLFRYNLDFFFSGNTATLDLRSVVKPGQTSLEWLFINWLKGILSSQQFPCGLTSCGLDWVGDLVASI